MMSVFNYDNVVMRTRDLPTTSRAQELRRSSTEAERRLWGVLRNRRLSGLKFTRQTPILHYFADFVCRERMLIIELDGSQHADSAYDNTRDLQLTAQGYRVLRFWNGELQDLDAMRNTILAAADRRLEPFDRYKTPGGLP